MAVRNFKRLFIKECTFNVKISIFYILLILSLTFISGFSQTTKVGTTVFPVCYPIYKSAFTKIGVDAWAAGGASIAEHGIPTGAFNNPAGINYDELTLYAEFGKRLNTKWLYDFDFDGQFIVPAYVSAAKPFGNWNIELGYMNYCDLVMNTQSEIRTIEHPEGTGEFYNIEKNINIYTFFCASSYAFNEHISLGLTLGLNYLNQYEKVYKLTAEGNGFGALIIFGVLFSPVNNFSIGTNLKFLTDIDYEMKINENDIFFDPDTTYQGNIVAINSEKYPYSANFPWTFEVGINYKPVPFVKLLAMLEYQDWRDVTDNIDNEVQIHLGAEISTFQSLAFRLGYFTMNDMEISSKEVFNQQFLSFGIKWSVNNKINLSASVMTSNLFDNEEFEEYYGEDKEQFHQTYISAGILYSF
jgi:long-subunit fatty acid transport protein